MALYSDDGDDDDDDPVHLKLLTHRISSDI